MRSLEDALAQFVYRPATPESARRHHNVRVVLMEAVEELWDVIPDGPEKTLAIRKLQEAGMYANLAIALTAPAAPAGTEAVARVLPAIAGDTEKVTVRTLAGVEKTLPAADLPLGGLPPADGCGTCQIQCGVCR